MKKIIYVDDINYSLFSFRSRLQKRYETYLAQSVDLLFEMLTHIKPDLILLDVNMPETDGFKAIELLKSDENYKDIKVVFLTSDNDKNSLIKGMTLGAADYLIKPVSDTDLFNCLELHLDPHLNATIKPIVLAIDDNPSILKTINHVLNPDYTVRTLANPEKLTELLKIIIPDIFLLDCNMPVYNGFDLVPLIRSIPEHAETPVIFLTSEGTIDNISVAISLGAADFIVKPIDAELLNAKISSQLTSYILKRRLRNFKAGE